MHKQINSPHVSHNLPLEVRLLIYSQKSIPRHSVVLMMIMTKMVSKTPMITVHMIKILVRLILTVTVFEMYVIVILMETLSPID